MFGWKNYPLSWMLYSNQICLNFLIIFHLSFSPKKEKKNRMPFIRDMTAMHKKNDSPFWGSCFICLSFYARHIVFNKKQRAWMHDRFQKAFPLVLLCTVVTCHVHRKARHKPTQLRSTLFIKSYDSEPKNQLYNLFQNNITCLGNNKWIKRTNCKYNKGWQWNLNYLK